MFYAIINGNLRVIGDAPIEVIDKVKEQADFVIECHSPLSKIEEIPKCLASKLKNQEFQRLQEILDQYGYKDLGDVRFWADQDPDDPEPKGLLEWYSAYDDAIWEEIDNLQNKTFEELKDYDPLKVEKQIFERTKDKLPPLEG